ncbi:MAG: hypothetical protein IIZ18_07340 [Ruminococcus sp.]|nr:hypothetical protein [Ruminococcus sp.]
MRIRTSRERRILRFKTVTRWILYYVLILFSFTLMTSGTFLKPVLLLPLALAISIGNDLMGSAFTGAFCGMLIDIACGRLFGYNAVLLTVFCVGISLAFDLYLRSRFLNYLWVTAVVSYIQCWLDYTFYYGIWNYEDVELIYRNTTLKVWVYTVISSVFIYLLVKLINHFLMPRAHLTIEEAIKTTN